MASGIFDTSSVLEHLTQAGMLGQRSDRLALGRPLMDRLTIRTGGMRAVALAGPATLVEPL